MWVRLAYLVQLGAVAWLLALMWYKSKWGFALPAETPAQRTKQTYTTLYCCLGLFAVGLHLARSFLTVESGVVAPKIGTFLLWSLGHIGVFVLLVFSWSNYMMWMNGNAYCGDDGVVTLPLPTGARQNAMANANANDPYYYDTTTLGAQPEPWQVDAAKAQMQDQQTGWVVRNVPSNTASSSSSNGSDGSGSITIPTLVSHVPCSKGFLALDGRVRASGNLSLATAFFVSICMLSAGWGFTSLSLMYSCYECKGGNRTVTTSSTTAAKPATTTTTSTTAATVAK